jgi:hypothetical protein
VNQNRPDSGKKGSSNHDTVKGFTCIPHAYLMSCNRFFLAVLFCAIWHVGSGTRLELETRSGWVSGLVLPWRTHRGTAPFQTPVPTLLVGMRWKLFWNIKYTPVDCICIKQVVYFACVMQFLNTGYLCYNHHVSSWGNTPKRSHSGTLQCNCGGGNQVRLG